jgi:ComF family protein
MAAILFDEAVPRFMRQAIHFFMPVNCMACASPLTDDPVPLFCTGCWTAISPSTHARCPRCDRPFTSPVATTSSPDHVCQSCAEQSPSYSRAWTLFPYLPPLQDAICLLKYRGKLALAAALARLMIDHLPSLPSVDVIMPVPLHRERLREREFNQSLLLADPISGHLRIPVSCTELYRVVASPPQTTLSRAGRLQNLRGAFALRRPDSVKDRRVLLIDDVYTTGATVNECARVLRKAGSGEVFVLTLARSMEAHMVPDRILARRADPAPLMGG